MTSMMTVTLDQWRQLVDSRYAPGKKPPNWIVRASASNWVAIPPTSTEAATIAALRADRDQQALNDWVKTQREQVITRARANCGDSAPTGSDEPNIAVTLDFGGTVTAAFLASARANRKDEP